MAEGLMKVKLKLKNVERYFYISIIQDWEKLLCKLASICNTDAHALRKFWIDAENDNIEIVDQDSYDIFLKNASHLHIFVRENDLKKSVVTPGEETREASTEQETYKSSVHSNITCDGCNKTPIVGFRYKCVQCPDYDLCANCEFKKVHREHVMFRFPLPVQDIPFNRRFLRKMKKGCFIYPDSEEYIPQRYSRHHNYQNVFSNLYTMMHDMAEGVEECKDEMTPKSEQKREKEDRKGRKCGTRCKNSEVEGISMDPNCVKLGVEILNNFSEMFHKMLNPFVVSDNVPSSQEEKNVGNSSEGNNCKFPQSNAETQSNEINTDEKTENDSPKNHPDSATTSSSEVPLVETKKPLEQEDCGWTVVNSPSSSNSSKGSSHSLAGSSISKAPEMAHEQVQDLPNYEQLSKDLFAHVQKAQFKSPDDAPEAKALPSHTEKKARIVFHNDVHINDAIHDMMAMGFSNENNCLTFLLESVNGNISQALDLLGRTK